MENIAMKQLLRKLFCWDAPAQGAFLALTVFFVASSLWFTFFLLWRPSDVFDHLQLSVMDAKPLGDVLVWAVGELLIALYSLTVFLRAIWLLAKSCHRHRGYLPLICALTAMLLWLCAWLFCLSPFPYLLRLLVSYGEPARFSPGRLMTLFGLSPERWWLSYLAAVLCMALGGFFTVVAVARGTGASLRHAVSKTALALWGVFWITYIVLLGLALAQSHEVSQIHSMVQKRFGHPLSIEGLREYYQKEGAPDDGFWKHLQGIMGQLPSELFIGDSLVRWSSRGVPDRLTPDFLTAFEDYCADNSAPLQEAEKCFDAIPPMHEFDLSGSLQFVPCRRFATLEMARLCVSLHRQDKDEALRTYQRIAHCASHLQREPFLIGSLVWLNVENLRLNAVERLLESRLLTEEELRRIASDLTTLEKRISENHCQAMFTEAVFGQEALRDLETGKAPGSVLAFGDLRFFFPQFWLLAASDKAFILLQCLAKDFTQMEDPPPQSADILSKSLLLVIKPSGNKFRELTARVLAMQALLRAEEYRREHGDFPEMLSDLPTDPFTGKPMQYRYGIAEISEYVLQNSASSPWEDIKMYEIGQEVRQAKVVQIWSIGLNGVDDGGVANSLLDKDDACATVRLE